MTEEQITFIARGWCIRDGYNPDEIVWRDGTLIAKSMTPAGAVCHIPPDGLTFPIVKMYEDVLRYVAMSGVVVQPLPEPPKVEG